MSERPLLHQRIVANAGSGKTYRLTTRFIELLARGVAPERIIALTFTRKAAGEFLDAIFARLLKASLDEELATRLGAEVGFARLKPDDFRAFLRLLIQKMPQLALGTLDGFFGRVVRVFPFECGLAGQITILDPHTQNVTRRAVLTSVFRSHLASERAFHELLELLRRQSRNRQARSITAVLDWEVQSLHEKFLLTPREIVWGDPATVWGRHDRFVGSEALPQLVEEFERQLFQLHEGMEEKHRAGWEKRLVLLNSLRAGNDVPKDASSFALKAIDPALSKKAGHFDLKLGNKIFPFPDSSRDLVRAMGRAVLAIDLQTRLDRSRALHQILAKFEDAYQRSVREAGKLTFLDITGFLAASQGAQWSGESLRAAVRQQIDYRLDASYDHWLLDEFQDTSRLQWLAIQSLVDEVIQSESGQRSFFYVGDTKQAIYSWRGGDPRLFQEIADFYNSGDEARIDTSESLATSFRSVPEILDGVNTIFGPDNLDRLAYEMEFPAAVLERWRLAWREHLPVTPKRGSGFLSWRTFTAEGSSTADTLDRETATLLAEIDPIARGWTCAVLVLTNRRIASVVNALRAAGLPAVAEGRLYPCTDNEFATAFLALLRFIAHPDDTLSQCHVVMSPLGALLGDDPRQFRLGALQRIREDGIANAGRAWMQSLDWQPNEFLRARMATFFEAAASFDASTGHSAPIDEFLEFAESCTISEASTGAAIRVMTMHASKGLDFDVVVLPEIEGTSLPSRRDDSSIHLHLGDGGEVQWGMELPPKAVCDVDETLRSAYEEDVVEDCYENLCLYYVALTRARRALYLLTSRQKEESKSHDFNRFLHLTNAEEMSVGDPQWYRAGGSAKTLELAPPLDRFPDAPRMPSRVPRISPSENGEGGYSVASCFSESSATALGVELHAALARGPSADIAKLSSAAVKLFAEFLDSLAAAACFRATAAEAQIWVEQPFDVLINGQRVSGVFDRVIVEPDTATLFDFKTEEASAAEILERHGGQMRLYRAALAILTGLPETKIAVNLVSVRDPALIPVD